MSRGVLAAACATFLFLGLCASMGECARPAGRSAAQDGGRVQDFHSPHFLIHTDLSASEAQKLLRKLETELKLISVYWGRPAQGVLECCVVKDLKNWPEELQQRMEPAGLAKIREGAGVCITRTASRGARFHGVSHVYAVAKDNTPLHEAVHGYCGQAFGHTGPHWYAEGMAEMGQYWIEGQKGVHVPEAVVRYLHKTTPRPMESLIANDVGLGGTWHDYCWWWLLCHLLENNTNYTAQFRAFGHQALIKNEKITFQDVFGPCGKELEFEFRFFLKHLENGYRVDLCSWNWNARFSNRDKGGHPLRVLVQADRGWQPSGLTVSGDHKYAYEATGVWKVGKTKASVGADGGSDGRGRLVGVVMKDYQLSKEFELGASGEFTAPEGGDLYLRCRVPWNKIAENSGKIAVELWAAE